jgi:D-glycero-alpha-D-manno-heptose-7-phosphate kinase
VLTATIDRYAYAMVSLTSNPAIQIATSDFVDEAQEEPTREILKQFGIRGGVSVFLTTELPTYSGMTAISAGAVALIRALAELQERSMTPTEIAEMACTVSVERLGLPVGIADFYGLAQGGINFVEVNGSGVHVESLSLPSDLLEAIQARLMLFFTGRLQKNPEPLEEFRKAAERNRASVIESLHEVKASAIALRESLLRGELDALGRSLDRTWRASRELARGMSDPWVDQWYDAALNAGAAGGKINGLAGLGFMVLVCEPDRQARVAEVMQSMGLTRVDVRLESGGVSVLLNESPIPEYFPPSQMTPSAPLRREVGGD